MLIVVIPSKRKAGNGRIAALPGISEFKNEIYFFFFEDLRLVDVFLGLAGKNSITPA